MTQAMGSNSKVGYEIETAFGVVNASPALKTLYFTNESIGEKINQITSQVIRSNRNPTKPVRGNRDVSGAISTELAPGLGTLLRAALGANTTTGAGSPYTHTIKVGALPSLMFEKAFTDLSLYYLFFGCKINKLSISAKPEGVQAISFDLIGSYMAQALKYDTQSGNFTSGLYATGAGGSSGIIKGDLDGGTSGKLILLGASGNYVDNEALTDSATGAATVDGTLGDTSLDSSWTDPGHSPWDGLSISVLQEGGSSIAYVQSVDVSIENNIDGSAYVIGGGGIRRYVPEGKVKVSGTIRALFESRALYDKAVRKTESSLKCTWSHGTGAGTAGNESLELYVPELYLSAETPVIEGDAGIYYNGPFEAFYDDGAPASSVQIILKNAEATI
jgi:hypothetical protein